MPFGADKTVQAAAAAGLLSTGTKDRGAASRPWYALTPVTIGRTTYNIAWLACTYGTNDIPDRHGQVLNCYKHKSRVLAEIGALAKRKDVAAVIVTPHWGAEYRQKPAQREVKLARAMAEAGRPRSSAPSPMSSSRWRRS